MNHCSLVTFILGIAAALIAPAGVLGGNCGVCHGEQQTAFLKSIHQDYHLYCVDCHGGDKTLDPKTLTGGRRKAACVDHPSFKGKIEATR
ncbi:MAG: hypothetical protein ACYTFG_07130, partial [Planctomycetota bacterium]